MARHACESQKVDIPYTRAYQDLPVDNVEPEKEKFNEGKSIDYSRTSCPRYAELKGLPATSWAKSRTISGARYSGRGLGRFPLEVEPSLDPCNRVHLATSLYYPTVDIVRLGHNVNGGKCTHPEVAPRDPWGHWPPLRLAPKHGTRDLDLEDRIPVMANLQSKEEDQDEGRLCPVFEIPLSMPPPRGVGLGTISRTIPRTISSHVPRPHHTEARHPFEESSTSQHMA